MPGREVSSLEIAVVRYSTVAFTVACYLGSTSPGWSQAPPCPAPQQSAAYRQACGALGLRIELFRDLQARLWDRADPLTECRLLQLQREIDALRSRLDLLERVPPRWDFPAPRTPRLPY